MLVKSPSFLRVRSTKFSSRLEKNVDYVKNLNFSSRVEILQRSLQFSWDEISTRHTRYTDFDQMTITVMKKSFPKLKPRLIYYRDYSVFSNNRFIEECLSKFSMDNISNTSNGLENFLQNCIDVLDTFFPQKKKCNRSMMCLLWINHLLGHIWKEVAYEIDFWTTGLKSAESILSRNAIIVLSLLRKTKKTI